MTEIPVDLTTATSKFVSHLCRLIRPTDKFKIIITQTIDDGFPCRPYFDCRRMNNSKFCDAICGGCYYAVSKFSEATNDWAFFWYPAQIGQQDPITFPNDIPPSVAYAFSSVKGVVRTPNGLSLEVIVDLPELHKRLMAEHPEEAVNCVCRH